MLINSLTLTLEQNSVSIFSVNKIEITQFKSIQYYTLVSLLNGIHLMNMQNLNSFPAKYKTQNNLNSIIDLFTHPKKEQVI